MRIEVEICGALKSGVTDLAAGDEIEKRKGEVGILTFDIEMIQIRSGFFRRFLLF